LAPRPASRTPRAPWGGNNKKRKEFAEKTLDDRAGGIVLFHPDYRLLLRDASRERSRRFANLADNPGVQ
jgi:hypothetical protein